MERAGLKWLVMFAHAPAIQLLETTQVTKLPVSMARLNFCGGVPNVIGTASKERERNDDDICISSLALIIIISLNGTKDKKQPTNSAQRARETTYSRGHRHRRW